MAWGVLLALALLYLLSSLRTVQQWEEIVVLTFGRYTRRAQPGLRLVWSVVQRGIRIDKRVVTTEFRTEGTLTRDRVPITLLAVLFWQVRDTERAALNVVNYRRAIDMAAQTALREAVSHIELEEILSAQERLDQAIAARIRERAEAWGVDVQSVQIRDLSIPPDLQAVLSRKAQAQAEKEARRIYGEAEVVAAEEFAKAARVYEGTAGAFRLRALTVLLEAVKSDRNTLLFVPTEVVDALRTALRPSPPEGGEGARPQ